MHYETGFHSENITDLSLPKTTFTLCQDPAQRYGEVYYELGQGLTTEHQRCLLVRCVEIQITACYWLGVKGLSLPSPTGSAVPAASLGEGGMGNENGVSFFFSHESRVIFGLMHARGGGGAFAVMGEPGNESYPGLAYA